MHLSSDETVLNHITASAEVRYRPGRTPQHYSITKPDADHSTQKNKHFFMIRAFFIKVEPVQSGTSPMSVRF